MSQGADDNRAWLASGARLTMPVLVLALGGEKSFRAAMAAAMRAAANNVEGIVPDSMHWIMEENPQATVKLVREFLAQAD